MNAFSVTVLLAVVGISAANLIHTGRQSYRVSLYLLIKKTPFRQIMQSIYDSVNHK